MASLHNVQYQNASIGCANDARHVIGAADRDQSPVVSRQSSAEPNDLTGKRGNDLSTQPPPRLTTGDRLLATDMVEANGFEPMTSGLQSRRSPN